MPTPSVLVVDDAASTLLVIRSILLHAHYDVVTRTSGGDALALLLARRFDLAVVDLNLLDMNAAALVMLARQKGTFVPPVLGMSNVTTAATIENALQAGIQAVLRKPVSYDALVSAARNAMLDSQATELIPLVGPVLDPNVLADIRSMGDEVLMREFVKEALLEARNCIAELDLACACNDDKRWTVNAQRMHGIALSLGARRLAAAAEATASISDLRRQNDCLQLLSRLFAEVDHSLAQDLGLLSQRERLCLRLAASGLSSKQIADECDISQVTVNFHLNNAASKLNAQNRAQAVAQATKLGAI